MPPPPRLHSHATKTRPKPEPDSDWHTLGARTEWEHPRPRQLACSIRLIVPRNMRILAKLTARRLTFEQEQVVAAAGPFGAPDGGAFAAEQSARSSQLWVSTATTRFETMQMRDLLVELSSGNKSRGPTRELISYAFHLARESGRAMSRARLSAPEVSD